MTSISLSLSLQDVGVKGESDCLTWLRRMIESGPLALLLIDRIQFESIVWLKKSLCLCFWRSPFCLLVDSNCSKPTTDEEATRQDESIVNDQNLLRIRLDFEDKSWDELREGEGKDEWIREREREREKESVRVSIILRDFRYINDE
jgi:hypothetical protein